MTGYRDKEVLDRTGDNPTDWRLQIRDGNLEAARQIPHDGTLRYTTEERDHVSYRKDSVFNLSDAEVVDQYETKTGRSVSRCKRSTCSKPAGMQDRDDYRTRFCSVQCETKHEHIKADARDAERTELRRSEPADFGGGESTGVKDL